VRALGIFAAVFAASAIAAMPACTPTSSSDDDGSSGGATPIGGGGSSGASSSGGSSSGGSSSGGSSGGSSSGGSSGATARHDDGIKNLDETDVDLEAVHVEDESARRLHAAIEKLPPLQRTILTLYHLDELPIGEIAAMTGLADGTIKSHLFRSRQRLRQWLETPGQVGSLTGVVT
jgi:RNA polymerase sigma factor (sigma-70 family)